MNASIRPSNPQAFQPITTAYTPTIPIPLSQVESALQFGAVSQTILAIGTGAFFSCLEFTVSKITIPLTSFGLPLMIVGLLFFYVGIFRKWREWKKENSPMVYVPSPTLSTGSTLTIASLSTPTDKNP